MSHGFGCVSIFGLTQKPSKILGKSLFLIFFFYLVLPKSFAYKYSRMLRDIVRKIRCVVLHWRWYTRLTASLKLHFIYCAERWAFNWQPQYNAILRNILQRIFGWVLRRRYATNVVCDVLMCLPVSVWDAAPHIRQWTREQQQHEHLRSHQHILDSGSHSHAGDRIGDRNATPTDKPKQRRKQTQSRSKTELLKLKNIFSVGCLHSS